MSFSLQGIGSKSRRSETPSLALKTVKFGLGVQNETGKIRTEFCQENTLNIVNTLFQQHKRRLYTWTSSDAQYWKQTEYILCSHWWRSFKRSWKIRPGADCGSDHEHLIAKFRFKLKKVGKTMRLFRYDQNQTPYDYSVEDTNGFMWLDLVDRVPEE